MIDRSQKPCRSLAFLLLMVATSCTWATKAQRSVYSEDLSKHRKTFTIATQEAPKDFQHRDKLEHVPIASLHAITEQLEELLGRKKLANEQIKDISGYTIQVYAGGSREAALKARNKLYMHYPSLQPEVKYDLPNYTVRVGRFLDKLEAYPVYAAIKKHLPQAIIRPISFANTPHVFKNKKTGNAGKPLLSIPATHREGQNH